MDKNMQTCLTNIELMEMEQRKRTNLINSIGGFKSLALIGTIDKLGRTNLAVFNSIVHISANPPLVGFITRPDSVERHTLSNILETGYYTINHVNQAIYKEAHQTSARYPKEVSEFDAADLMCEYKNEFMAPYVQQSFIQLGIQFKQRIDIEINGTSMLIGQIMKAYFPGNCWCEDGFVDIEKAQTITCSGLDSYHLTTRISRLSYAKPGKELSVID
jgi:flavin reductase (DIM6/NTAB) family NADH-FMN oxidoreductase RutF